MRNRTNLQRKCACGRTAGPTGECEECGKKRLQQKEQKQWPRTQSDSSVPPIVDEVLRSPGQPLDRETRAFFESRLGHDFSKVRIHTDSKAAESAEALRAHAYTAGSNVVFAKGLYSLGGNAGRQLLAHELAHVVQQHGASSPPKLISPSQDPLEGLADRAASAASSGRAASAPERRTGSLQRQADLRLTMPTYQPPLKPSGGLSAVGQAPGLSLDPSLQAYSLLDPDMIRQALAALDISSTAAPQAPAAVEPSLTPPAQAPQASSTPGAQAPLVPRGAGPSTPRTASAGDVLGAIAAIPDVRTKIASLRDMASDRLKRDWRSLSVGDKVVVIGVAATVSAGAIAGIVSNDSARELALKQIQGRALPVPAVPGLSFQVTAIGSNKSVMLNLDLSALAKKLGF